MEDQNAETKELSIRNGAQEMREVFCIEYAKDKNATKAAERAGYSVKSARQQGAYLLTIPAIRVRIDELRRGDLTKRIKDLEELREMLTDAATLDLAELMDQGRYGISLKEFHEMDPRFRRLITEVSNVSGKSGWRVNFKVYKKETAVDQLMRIFGVDDPTKGSTVNNINVQGDLKVLVTKYLK